MKKTILASLVILTIILFCMNTMYPDTVFADSNAEDIELKIINRNSQEINKSESIEIGTFNLHDKLSKKPTLEILFFILMIEHQ